MLIVKLLQQLQMFTQQYRNDFFFATQKRICGNLMEVHYDEQAVFVASMI